MLSALTSNHVVQSYSAGFDPVWRVARNQHLAASYYRNSLIHHYLDRSISELALMKLANSELEDPLHRFWDEVSALRDLLKFDFFFPDKDKFAAAIDHDLSLEEENWQERVKAGAEATRAFLQSLRPLTAHFMLRSFVEAYEVVAQVLLDERETADEGQLRKRPLSVGRQYLTQRQVSTPEAVSAMLFRTGVRLAAHEGLLSPSDDQREKRMALATRLRELHAHADGIEKLSELRRLSDAAVAFGD